MTSLASQRLTRPGSNPNNSNSNASEDNLLVEKRRKEYHFVQISPNLYVPCDAHGNTIAELFPKLSIKEQMRDVILSSISSFSSLFHSTQSSDANTRRNNSVSSRNWNASLYQPVSESTSSNQSIEMSALHKNMDGNKSHSSTAHTTTETVDDDADDLENPHAHQRNSFETEDESEYCLFNSQSLDQEIQRIQSISEKENHSSESNSNNRLTVSPVPFTNHTPTRQPQQHHHQTPTQCVVCLNHFVNCIIYDCGHSVTCLACGISLAKKRSSNQCPICRAKITILFEMTTRPFPLNNQKFMINSSFGYYFHFLSSPNEVHALVQQSSTSTTNHRNTSIANSLPSNQLRLFPATMNFFATNPTISYHDSIIDIILN